MKKTFLIVASVILTVSAFSQEQKSNKNISDLKTISVPENKTLEKSGIHKNKPVTISKRAGEQQQVHNEQYYLKEIEKVETHLNAIDSKVEFVLNDPNEKAVAEQNGWFEKMTATKSRLTLKKKALQSKLQQL